MKEIIERKLKKLNRQYDEYLNRWDKIEDTVSFENDYITDRLNNIRSNIRLCNEILEEIKENNDEEKGRYERKLIKSQSNWNSLRKELYQANRELVTNELVNGKELINNIIDIMNELERGDNK